MAETTKARMREALTTIARVAGEAVDGNGYDIRSDRDAEQYEEGGGGEDVESPRGAVPGCTIKPLPDRLVEKAARVATKINPVNAPLAGAQASRLGFAVPDDPLAIAVMTTKYWGAATRRLTVSFMTSAPANLRTRIIAHLNAWQCGITFVPTSGVGQVRISLGPGGYWSYLGTDVLLIPRNRPTMNLERFSMTTSESEYRRVVRHEAGHTLGFPHEHMRRELVARIDRQKAYDYFRRTQGWDQRTVDQQVLTALDDRTIYGTPADQTSIMCYQLPASITRDGRPILGGTDINRTDGDFARRIYPRPGRSFSAYGHEPESAPEHAEHAHGQEEEPEDWDPAEDPEVDV